MKKKTINDIDFSKIDFSKYPEYNKLIEEDMKAIEKDKGLMRKIKKIKVEVSDENK